MLEKQQKRHRRHKRIRAKIIGTANRPRLCVFRSMNHIYAQLIDDDKGETLISASDREFKKLKSSSKEKSVKKEKEKITGKIAKAFEVGKLIAKKELEKNIKKIVFDRGKNKYHGRVKAVAEGAREGGLEF
ncbi:MAG: 50S ribosomal protein L18 [Candidatus Magasanikbacteria bacterium]|nr:50S ribosomal protein L18 [Candidatus Magasanikbacteria bacterium]